MTDTTPRRTERDVPGSALRARDWALVLTAGFSGIALAAVVVLTPWDTDSLVPAGRGTSDERVVEVSVPASPSLMEPMAGPPDPR